MLLWLWCRPAAAAPILPLAWEPPHASGAALKKQNKSPVSAGEGWCGHSLHPPRLQIPFAGTNAGPEAHARPLAGVGSLSPCGMEAERSRRAPATEPLGHIHKLFQ